MNTEEDPGFRMSSVESRCTISVERDVHNSLNLWVSNCKHMKKLLETI